MVECNECGAVVGIDIIGLTHICNLGDKFIHNLKDSDNSTYTNKNK